MKNFKNLFASIKKRYLILLRNGFSVETVYGCKWLIDWSNNIDKKLSSKSFEDSEIRFLIQQVKSINPNYFLDIGAHAGLYSIIIKNNFPDITIFSFEPDRQNRYQFLGNLFLNKLENKIEIFDIGLSNQDKEVFFGFRKDAQGKRGGKAIQSNGNDKIKVNKLDNILSLENNCCFIKIDVEGHEKEVALGAKKFLSCNKCLVQVELWDEKSFKSFEKIMVDLNYNLLIKNNNSQNCYFTNINSSFFII